MKRRAWAVALAALILGALGGALRPQPAEAPILFVALDGPVSPASSDFVRRGLAEAAARGAPALVLRLDTPGGLDASMREIIQAILASPAPVIAWVAPSGARAASAGLYIVYASHLAAMAPATNIGAATPVRIGAPAPPGGEGEKAAPDDMRAKIVNDAAAYLRGLAELRGRNAEWAEKAVREAASLAAADAHEQGVVELIAADLDALLREADGRTVKIAGEARTLALAGRAVERLEPDWRTALLGVVANPNLALLLMLLGFYGLLFELISPGAVFPGVIGGVSLLLALYALSVLPVNLAGIGLVALGAALLVAEAFAPSFGALGLGGVVAMLIGAVMLFDMDVPGFELSPAAIAAAGALSLMLLAAIVWVAARARKAPVRSGREWMIGQRATVLEWSGERGRVRFGGEDWRARGPEGLAPGQRVRVREVRDLTLAVEPDEPGGAT